MLPSLWIAIRKIVNPNYRLLRQAFGNKHFTLLDVGAGNHSATRITTHFPRCRYYGLDYTRDYNNDEEDFARMQEFFLVDLRSLDYPQVPDRHFDAIWIVHVIEHLEQGEEVLRRLIPKLRPEGYIYVEYPGKRSLHLPSMHGSLNFRDDPTHVRVYDAGKLAGVLESAGCQVLRKGTRRNPYYIAATPFRVLATLILGKRLSGNIFWDLLGFAEFVYARRKEESQPAGA